MGIKQHRRTISFKPELYARLKYYCKQNKVSMAGFVEAAAEEALDDVDAPEIDRTEAIEARKAHRLPRPSTPAPEQH